MFERTTAYGTHCSDETDSYDIVLHRPYTVKAFIETVLTKYRQEWGFISVMNCHIDLEDSFTYKYGVLESEINGDIMDRQIENATGHGGWSNVNYVLYLKAPFLESKCGSRKNGEFQKSFY